MSTTAAQTTPSARPEVALGYDDGFRNNKVAGPNGAQYTTPSQVRRGPRNVVAMSGSGPDIGEFRIGETHYSAGHVDGESTHFDEYPHSELSRVMAFHTLYAAGYGGCRLRLATGLPIKLYYRAGTGEVNEDYVAKKKQNLHNAIDLVHASPTYGDTPEPFEVLSHEVLPEGLVAWFHLLIDERGDGPGAKPVYRKSLESEPVGFIDMGGRTTDLAVVVNGEVDLARSRSIEHGMINVRQRVREAICARYDLSKLSDQALEQALAAGKARIFGKSVDVADIIKSAKHTELEIIRDQVRTIFGAGAELSQVQIFGGAALDFRDLLTEQAWFRHQQMADNPLYVNAIGMYKFIRYVAGD